MSCSLENFNKEFNNGEFLKDEYIDLSTHPRAEHLKQWANLANRHVNQRGFDAPLFELLNKDGKEQLFVNEKAHQAYDEYFENVLKPERYYLDISQKEEYHDFLIEGVLPQFIINFDNLDYDPLSRDSVDIALNETHTESFRPKDELSIEPGDEKSWIQALETISKEMLNLALNKQKQGAKSSSISAIYKSRNKIKQDLLDSKREDFSTYDSMMGEITFLQDLIKDFEDSLDSVESAQRLEDNLVERRIEVLDHMLNYYEGDKEGRKLKHSWIKEYFSDSEFKDLVTSFNTLQERFFQVQDRIVISAVTNSELVSQLRHSSNTEEEIKKLEEIAAKLLENLNDISSNQDINKLAGSILGLASLDSPLANYIAVQHRRNEMVEAGRVRYWIDDIESSYKELIKYVGDEGNMLIDLLYPPDEFGIQRGLVDFISPDYVFQRSKIRKARVAFYKATGGEREFAYDNWIKTIMEVSTIFDFGMLPQVHKVWGNNKKYKDYFGTEAEMKAYEKEMREKYGDAVYEITVNKILERIDIYDLNEYIDKKEEIAENPFAFTAAANLRLRDELAPYFESGENYNPLLPTFSVDLPKDSEMISKDFKEAEKQFKDRGEKAGKNFAKYYKAAYESSLYANKSLSQSSSTGRLELINLPDALNREALKSLSTFGKISKKIQQFIIDYFQVFSTHKIENPSGDKNYNPEVEREISTNYVDRRKKSVSNQIKILKEKSNKELLDILEKANRPIPEEYYSEELSGKQRSKLLEAAANSRVEEVFSLDYQKRHLTQIELARSLNVREQTDATARMIQTYAERKGMKNLAQAVEDIRNASFIQPGSLDNKNIASQVTRLSLGKDLTEEEKELKKVLEERLEREKKGGRGEDEFYNFSYEVDGKILEFFYEPPKIKGAKGIQMLRMYDAKNRAKIGEAIPIDNPRLKDIMKETYIDYLTEEIENIGRHKVLGRVINGLFAMFSRSFFLGNVKSGVKTRHESLNQLKESAATGKYGYTIEEYNNARKFLNKYAIQQYIEIFKRGNLEEGFASLEDRMHLDQIKILRNFSIRLGLFQKQAQMRSGGDGVTQNIEYAHLYENKLMDLSITNPENFGQMVLLLSLMQNDMFAVTDKDGNRVKLFDPKTGQTVFDPETMRLKDEFRYNSDGTENIKNIRMWEEFNVEEGEENPALLFSVMFDEGRMKNFGDYSLSLRAAHTNFILSKVITSNIAWSFEGMNRDYGRKKIDLVFKELEDKGRIRTLLQSPALTLAYTIANYFSSSLGIVNFGREIALAFSDVKSLRVGSALGRVAIAPFTSTFRALTGLGSIIVMTGWSVAKVLREVRADQKELGISLYKAYSKRYLNNEIGKSLRLGVDLTKETALRSIWTFLNVATGHRQKIFTPEKLEKFIDTASFEGTPTFSPKDRRELSALTQRIANKTSVAIQYALYGLAATVLFNTLSKLAFGDEEELEEEELAKFQRFLRFYERQMNGLTNRRALIQSEIGSYDSPDKIIDLYTSFVHLTHFNRLIDNSLESIENIAEGKGTGKDYLNLVKAPAGAVGFPNTFLNVITGNYYGADRTYNEMTTPERAISDMMQGKEKLAERSLQTFRAEIRRKMEPKIKSYIKEIEKERGGGITEEERKEIRSRIHTNFYLRHGLIKRPYSNQSYFDLNNNVDLQEVRDDLKDFNPENYNIKKATKRKKIVF